MVAILVKSYLASSAVTSVMCMTAGYILSKFLVAQRRDFMLPVLPSPSVSLAVEGPSWAMAISFADAPRLVADGLGGPQFLRFLLPRAPRLLVLAC